MTIKCCDDCPDHSMRPSSRSCWPSVMKFSNKTLTRDPALQRDSIQSGVLPCGLRFMRSTQTRAMDSEDLHLYIRHYTVFPLIPACIFRCRRSETLDSGSNLDLGKEWQQVGVHHSSSITPLAERLMNFSGSNKTSSVASDCLTSQIHKIALLRVLQLSCDCTLSQSSSRARTQRCCSGVACSSKTTDLRDHGSPM